MFKIESTVLQERDSLPLQVRAGLQIARLLLSGQKWHGLRHAVWLRRWTCDTERGALAHALHPRAACCRQLVYNITCQRDMAALGDGHSSWKCILVLV